MAKRRQLYIGFSTRILILCILFIFGIVMAITFFVGATETKVNNVVAYSSSNIDYKVYLKDNTFYETNILPADMEYVASLIDYIDVDIDYKITSTEKMNYNYTYSIETITKVYGDSSKTKVLFQKSNTILEDKTLNVKDTDNVSIKENIKIDYNEYNLLIASFKTSYSLTSVSDVTVILHVKATGNDEVVNKNVNINENAELVIPLTEKTVDVKIAKSPAFTYNVVDSSENFVIKNKRYVVYSSVLAIISLLLLIKILKMKNVTIKKSTKYSKKLKRILRDYDLIIANVNHSIDESKYEIINVASFEELKDVHDNIGTPILFNEIHKGQKSSFIIVKDNFLYKYVLKAVDLDKK